MRKRKAGTDRDTDIAQEAVVHLQLEADTTKRSLRLTTKVISWLFSLHFVNAACRRGKVAEGRRHSAF